jgi:NADPH-dependent 2,4-dienoyl-CoA reductase/sulfur reductase-like enzyme
VSIQIIDITFVPGDLRTVVCAAHILQREYKSSVGSRPWKRKFNMDPREHAKLGGGGDHPHGANGSASGTTPAFTLRNEPVENLRPLRVVVVGAGFSGIVAAIRIPEKLRNVDLTVYEKNEGLGGVW